MRVLAVNTLGDWLREVLDPRLRQIRGQSEIRAMLEGLFNRGPGTPSQLRHLVGEPVIEASDSGCRAHSYCVIFRLGSDGDQAAGRGLPCRGAGGGGSFSYTDPDRHFGIVLAKNYLCQPSVGNSTVFVPDEGPRRVYEAVAEALGILR